MARYLWCAMLASACLAMANTASAVSETTRGMSSRHPRYPAWGNLTAFFGITYMPEAAIEAALKEETQGAVRLLPISDDLLPAPLRQRPAGTRPILVELGTQNSAGVTHLPITHRMHREAKIMFPHVQVSGRDGQTRSTNTGSNIWNYHHVEWADRSMVCYASKMLYGARCKRPFGQIVDKPPMFQLLRRNVLEGHRSALLNADIQPWDNVSDDDWNRTYRLVRQWLDMPWTAGHGKRWARHRYMLPSQAGWQPMRAKLYMTPDFLKMEPNMGGAQLGDSYTVYGATFSTEWNVTWPSKVNDLLPYSSA
ncbi:hypothetical protein THASP1DRAFT_23903 [Thamnocephalis sphaerospora]|uniref:Uncharacterized protein n=1 Tax=Thamnocephalis sphaerospora TaxID=78915 RepID=A0A4P9XPU2_9FUNG|nr:hypothetical protein THASP1DRAFT_23903 [Thamnocephalis sphaerospora]|eukprot:RKP08034.1 hypothetical protein THASP1DRAFT_23903 [Thamnocephalis sphaerospora]